jgi:hypothetical protein
VAGDNPAKLVFSYSSRTAHYSPDSSHDLEH